ncbi:hypothetical protein G647_07612 [Cladophialophora carrionii CBS 160.54]|uniref:HTH psq-type domain-containing protein n=1 Tax=Cladophialophora carrionii CBS 160.54 TaxID=1279043 RepID=V9D5J1_9EURO|nr:uncharacterized protein G647_07612 [Cladophialophora carrionii CBS 160.54]ETI21267.1 hypothetical protein G647_07612 [Cladophialophora carrionii CBS 160.54]
MSQDISTYRRSPAVGTTVRRRVLTDEIRRQICADAEDDPTLKQGQLAVKHGLERSTISKILRKRDKYMNLQSAGKTFISDGDSQALTKRLDLEKTSLPSPAGGVENQRDRGLPITTDSLQGREQGERFSTTEAGPAIVSHADLLETSSRRKDDHTTQKSDADSTLADSGTASVAQTPLRSTPASSSDILLGSTPTSPAAEDDIMRALHAMKALLDRNPGVASSDDYVAVGRLQAILQVLLGENERNIDLAGQRTVGKQPLKKGPTVPRLGSHGKDQHDTSSLGV